MQCLSERWNKKVHQRAAKVKQISAPESCTTALAPEGCTRGLHQKAAPEGCTRRLHQNSPEKQEQWQIAFFKRTETSFKIAATAWTTEYGTDFGQAQMPEAHVHQMPEAAARCRQRAGSPEWPDPGFHHGLSPTDQAAMAWPDYHRAEQRCNSYCTEASNNSSEFIPGTENLMRIPPKPIRKQRFSIRIQWRSHQSLSEKRGFVKTLQKPWGRVGIFDLLLQSRPPPKKNVGGLPFTIVDVTLLAMST